jgi:hypothetical protein
MLCKRVVRDFDVGSAAEVAARGLDRGDDDEA